MSRPPELDLPEYFPSDIELRLQDPEIFDGLHATAERLNLFYAVAHTAVLETARISLASPSLTNGVNIGIKAYEIASSITNPSDTYTGDDEKCVVLASTGQFASRLRSPEDFTDLTGYAQQRLVEDAPQLTELIEQVSFRHTDHDKVATDFALKGAACIRGMHIYVDRTLNAPE